MTSCSPVYFENNGAIKRWKADLPQPDREATRWPWRTKPFQQQLQTARFEGFEISNYNELRMHSNMNVHNRFYHKCQWLFINETLQWMHTLLGSDRALPSADNGIHRCRSHDLSWFAVEITMHWNQCKGIKDGQLHSVCFATQTQWTPY